jgi:hypothetical protein
MVPIFTPGNGISPWTVEKQMIYSPMPPIPEMTRPTVRAFMLGALPHTTVPAEKNKTVEQNKTLTSKLPYSYP